MPHIPIVSRLPCVIGAPYVTCRMRKKWPCRCLKFSGVDPVNRTHPEMDRSPVTLSLVDAISGRAVSS